MATKYRFVTTGAGGKVHTLPAGEETCPTVRKYPGKFKGKRSLSADAALALPGCLMCGTHMLAEQAREEAKTPAEKQRESKDRAQATLDKLKPKTSSRKRGPVDKPAKERRGPRQSSAEGGREKAQEHLDVAKKHGWKVKLEETAVNEWTGFASQEGQVARIVYRDGRNVLARVVMPNGDEVRLRNSKTWLKQITLPKEQRPGKEGAGATKIRVGSKKQLRADDDGADNTSDLPFDVKEASDEDVLAAVLGRTIIWRNHLTKKLDQARVPTKSRNSRVAVHPRSGRRILSFYEYQGTSEGTEVLGGERSVYIDKIIRVR